MLYENEQLATHTHNVLAKKKEGIMIVDTEELEVAPIRTSARRLNFVLSETAFSDLQSLAKQGRHSMTEVVRYGIGIMKIAMEAHRQGHRLMIVDPTNRAVREIVIPG